MITVRTSPQYVNRVRQDWMANGGVYGDGGISALVPSNDPFAQLGPTLDLTFAGNPTDLLTASTTAGYTLDTYFTPETYQIAVPYAIWEDGVGLSQKTFAQIVTFTRASTATYFNSAGVLTSASNDVARFDYDPSTLAPLGLLIEEARTNSIRNNTMVGAVAGTPGTLPTNWSVGGTTTGLTREIVGTNTENGITYVDMRFSGTAGAALNPNIIFEVSNAITALNGQTWTSSFYLSLVGGSLSNVTNIIPVVSMFNSTPTLIGTLAGSAITPTNAALRTQRNSFAATLNQAATAFIYSQIQFSVANGAAIDITLRIGLPQLEQGAFATSVIPTTTTALTRSADVASVNTLSPWFNTVNGTLYAEYSRFGAANFQSVANLGEPTFFNQYALGFGSGAPSNNNRFDVVAGNVSQASITVLTTPALNTIAKIAGAYAVNDFAATANGAVPGVDTAGSLPSGTTVLGLGCNPALNGGFLNGHIRRISYYPRRLTNAELQAITA